LNKHHKIPSNLSKTQRITDVDLTLSDGTKGI
jgi:hypothetical protein